MKGMKRILLINVVLCVFMCFMTVSVYSSWEKLNQLTLDEFDEHFHEFSDEEIKYVMKLIEDPLEKILPLDEQEKILQNEYLTIENLISEIHYVKIWSVECKKINFYNNDYFELHKIQKKENLPNKTLAFLLFDKTKKTFRVIGFSRILLEQYNNYVDIDLSSPQEMLSYSKEVVLLAGIYTKIVEQDLIDNSINKYFKKIKDKVYSPKIIYQSEKYFFLDLFGIRFYERGIVVDKLLIAVTNKGKISITKIDRYMEF